MVWNAISGSFNGLKLKKFISSGSTARVFINPHKDSYIEKLNRVTRFALESAINKYKDTKYEKIEFSSSVSEKGE
jgi:hypothetical protein